MIHPVDPLTFLVCRCGTYWREANEASPIDPRTLPTGGNQERRLRLDPMQPSKGVIGERVAERPHGRPHKTPY